MSPYVYVCVPCPLPPVPVLCFLGRVLGQVEGFTGGSVPCWGMEAFNAFPFATATAKPAIESVIPDTTMPSSRDPLSPRRVTVTSQSVPVTSRARDTGVRREEQVAVFTPRRGTNGAAEPESGMRQVGGGVRLQEPPPCTAAPLRTGAAAPAEGTCRRGCGVGKAAAPSPCHGETSTRSAVAALASGYGRGRNQGDGERRGQSW